MISLPRRKLDNCSATVLFNPRDALHNVPIRRDRDCADRKRLHGHGERRTSTIAPYAKRLVHANDPTGGDRNCGPGWVGVTETSWRFVGDVVAQLPLTLDFQRR